MPQVELGKGRDSTIETEEEEQVEVKNSGAERGRTELWLGHVHGTSADTRGRSGQTALGFMAHTLHLN